MRQHSHRRQTSPRKTQRRLKGPTPGDKKPLPAVLLGNEQPNNDGSFVSLLLQRISLNQLNGLSQRKHGAGRPITKLTRGQLLLGILFHYAVSWTGTLGEHLFWLLKIQMTESALSERRLAVPFEVFVELMRRMLLPIPEAPAQAFYKSLRLTGVDGVAFSLANTKQINSQRTKGGNQKGKAAFAKLYCAALVELVMHNPLMACIGINGESEWKLAQGLVAHLPPMSLLLGDRLYGCAAFLIGIVDELKARQSHFLVRVKKSLKATALQVLADGSRLMEVEARDAKSRRVLGRIQLREIQATLQRPGHRPVAIRLWTSLLDCAEHPAKQLVALYISRWEEELYFRELKRELAVNDLLRSQTVETAGQEVAAMIIASSLIAHERAKLKPGEELAHRISFIKVWETLEPLWLTLSLGADILTEQQKQQLAERFYFIASRRMMPRKRIRSCPRALRQPIQPWPRKKHQKDSTDPVSISINLRAS